MRTSLENIVSTVSNDSANARSQSVAAPIWGEDCSPTISYLGLMHKDQGRYEKSEECLQRAVAIYEQSDPRGIDLALTINSLGWTYGMQGRYSEAEAMFGRALDLIEKSVGSTNPYWTDITKNLPLVYQNEGLHKEAEQLLKRIPDRQWNTAAEQWAFQVKVLRT